MASALAPVAGLSELPASIGIRRSAALTLTMIRPLLSKLTVVWELGIPIPIPLWLPGGRRQLVSTAPPSALSVSTILITPARRAAFVGDRIAYSGQSRDTSGAVVHGIKHTWSTPDATLVSIDEAGRAVMLKSGLARIVCAAGPTTATALVLIRPGNRGAQSDSQWGHDQGSGTSAMPGGGGGGGSAALVGPPAEPRSNREGLLSRLIEKLAPTVEAQSGGGSGSAWTTNPWVIGTPRNGVIEPTRFGAVLPESFNYELTIPVVASLGNRELNVPLALYYNSQIYSMTSPTTLQFDPNQSWPSPGCSMGFGRIDTTFSPDYSTAYYTLVEPNGTRHYLGSGPASVTGAPPPYPTYTTSDGTYISYVGDALHGGELYYPSGTKYDINLVNNRLLVTQITSTNGNYIQMGYMQNMYDGNGNPIPPVYSPFALSYVVDTLGRQINFGYDTSSGQALLTSVTGPAGGATFTYQQKNLITNFYSNTFGQMTVQGLPPIGGQGYPAYWALTSINAQQFYQMSYSDYGMAYSFTMGRSNTAAVTFDYPTSGSTQLGGAPAFTQRTESSGTVHGTYSYSVGNTVTTITRPDTSTMILTDNGTGLLAQSEIKLGTQSFAKMVYTYGTDPGGASQAVTAKSYDDNGTARRIDYAYDQFGNVTSKLEYGFQVNGPWQRKTTVAYAGAPYTTSFMRNLAMSLNVYDPNNSQIAGTSYSRDGYGSIQSYSQQSTAPSHLSNYDSAYTLRGNVTTVTRLTDVAHATSTSRSASYDVFGNTVQIQLDCCNQKTLTYSQNTYWSQPDQTASGSGSTTLTNSSVYNFNTSATTSTTDPNGLKTTYNDNGWLQPTQIDPPGGANFGLGYGDWGDLNATSVSYTDGSVNKSFSASVAKDGWGNAIQLFDPYGNQINQSFDSMGRLSSRTNPFPHNGTPGPATGYQYDTLGRVTAVTLPNSQTMSYSFSGSTVVVTDQVGRKKQQQYDALGRLTVVTEQDPSTGQLTLTTSYSYDFLDNLTQVNQRNQIRTFKRDAIGRELYERIPEQAATINDGTGTMWSCAYTYTDFGAVATRTDARGVVTSFSYDTHNRLISKSYNISNAQGVEPTNAVTWTYDTSSTSTTKGLLLSITMTGTLPTYQENFYYDSLNRLSYRTWSRDGQSYTVRYQHNNIKQLTQIIYPSGRVVNVNHDSVGRLASLSDGTTQAQYLGSITFNAAGRVTGDRLGDGVTEAFTYDSQTLQMIGQTASAPGGASGGVLNLNYSYQATAGQLGVGTTAGNAGPLVSISNSSIGGIAEGASYTYDLLGRLVTSTQSSNGQSAQRRYANDNLGNRTGEWDAVTGGNQLENITLQQAGGVPTNRIQTVTTPSGTTTYTYDAAGNLTGDGVHAYQYDCENRLRTVDGGSAISYAYDYRNNRIKKTVAGTAIHYVWEGNNVIAEHNALTGSQIVDYVLWRGRPVGEGAGSIFSTTSAFTYQVSDKLSERVSLDNAGNVIGRQGHLSFGEEFGESGTQEKHHFTSYESDSETGLDYAVNRSYSSNTGRFLTVDRFRGSGRASAPQSWNRYSYTHGDPINNTDRRGLDDCPEGSSPSPDGGCVSDQTEDLDGGTVHAGDDENLQVEITFTDWGNYSLPSGSGSDQGSNDDTGDPSDTPPPKRQDIIDAVHNALDRKACSDLLKGVFGQDPKALFDALLAKGQFVPGDHNDPGFSPTNPAYTTGTGEDATIRYDPGDPNPHNSYLGFMGWASSFARGHNLDPAQGAAVGFLHELAHATGAFVHPGDQPTSDQTQTIGSRELNQKIYDACFK